MRDRVTDDDVEILARYCYAALDEMIDNPLAAWEDQRYAGIVRRVVAIGLAKAAAMGLVAADVGQPYPERRALGWGVVEIMGHQRLAGRLSEVSAAGRVMLRVDVPELGPDRPAWSRLLSEPAIFAIVPLDEDVARIMAARLEATPVEPWLLESDDPEPASDIPF